VSTRDGRVRGARRHAKAIGLRLVVRRDGSVDLLAADGTILRSGLEASESYLAERYPNQRQGRNTGRRRAEPPKCVEAIERLDPFG
jgi:hypothetical protein